MTHLEEVHFGAEPLDRFVPLLGKQHVRKVQAIGRMARQRFKGRVVWNVNSTAVGGGVAEMLQSLLAYSRGAGIDARWLVIRGNSDFFRVTKRLHHALHGARGDGSPLGEAEHRVYQETLRENAVELVSLVKPRDVVILHDPQPAGLAASLLEAGALVIWRCHIGADKPNEEVEGGWRFLFPYVQQVPFYIFTRQAYVPDYCDHGKAEIIPPSIDAFSPKNQALDEDTVRAILVHVGLVEGPPPTKEAPVFAREDETPGRVERCADVVRLGRAPAWETPLVVQVSRWDPLKDPVGVLQGFARLVEGGGCGDAHLVLAGPDVQGVADDPEAAQVFDETLEAWRALPPAIRGRVHLACLPTADVEENAVIVNALQRHAAVVVQKSLREGFGLTVAEAMWKGRPVVASAVGGIQDQIDDGVHGLLLPDPSDRDALADALGRVLSDAALAARLGAAARERVRERYLGLRHLVQYAKLLDRLDRALQATVEASTS